jgi:hypothetical protein
MSAASSPILFWLLSQTQVEVKPLRLTKEGRNDKRYPEQGRMEIQYICVPVPVRKKIPRDFGYD